MAGLKNKAVVAVVSDLTDTQAAELMTAFVKAKGKYAPKGRGTIASGDCNNVGNLIQKGHKKAGIAVKESMQRKQIA